MRRDNFVAWVHFPSLLKNTATSLVLNANVVRPPRRPQQISSGVFPGGRRRRVHVFVAEHGILRARALPAQEVQALVLGQI